MHRVVVRLARETQLLAHRGELGLVREVGRGARRPRDGAGAARRQVAHARPAARRGRDVVHTQVAALRRLGGDVAAREDEPREVVDLCLEALARLAQVGDLLRLGGVLAAQRLEVGGAPRGGMGRRVGRRRGAGARARLEPRAQRVELAAVLLEERLVVDGDVLLCLRHHHLAAPPELERGQRLLRGAALLRNGADHRDARVAAQRRLQQARQLRVAVGDVLLRVGVRRWLRELGNHRAERQQRLVDVRALLAPRQLARRALAAGQVDQVQLRDPHAALRRLAALDRQLEDGVRARAARVPVGRADVPCGLAALQQREDLGGGRDDLFVQVRERDAPALLDDARRMRGCGTRRRRGGPARRRAARRGARRRGREQVLERLVVDFQEGHTQQELALGRVADHRKHVVHRTRDHARLFARAAHRVRLARARLAVGKHGAVVALHRGAHHGEHGAVVQALGALVAEHQVVKAEVVRGRAALVVVRRGRGAGAAPGALRERRVQRRRRNALVASVYRPYRLFLLRGA